MGLLRYNYTLAHTEKGTQVHLSNFLPYEDLAEDREPTVEEAMRAFGEG